MSSRSLSYRKGSPKSKCLLEAFHIARVHQSPNVFSKPSDMKALMSSAIIRAADQGLDHPDIRLFATGSICRKFLFSSPLYTHILLLSAEFRPRALMANYCPESQLLARLPTANVLTSRWQHVTRGSCLIVCHSAFLFFILWIRST
jgi:hypothetical protein